MIAKICCVVLLVAVGLIQSSTACNGYKATVTKVENCAGADGIIQIDEGFSIRLNKKCELVPTGCVTNKAFNTAKGKYTLKKDNNVIREGNVDLCEAAGSANGDAKAFMRVFAVPESCPVTEKKICADDHRVDLSKYKNMLSMAKGAIMIDATIDHDTGSSCFHVELEISK